MEIYTIRFKLDDLKLYPNKKWDYAQILSNCKEINLNWLRENFENIYFFRMTYIYNIKNLDLLVDNEYFEDPKDVDSIWIKTYPKNDNRALELLFYYLGKNINLDLDIYFEYKDSNWDWKTLSKNPKLNSQMLLYNIDKDWDWTYLSDKRCVTLDVVKECNNIRLFSYTGENNKNKLHLNPNFKFITWYPILEIKYKTLRNCSIPFEQKKYMDNYRKVYGLSGIKIY